MMIKYFIFFYFCNGNKDILFGSCGIDAERPVCEMEDLRQIKDMIEKRLNATNIVIINWKRFEPTHG